MQLKTGHLLAGGRYRVERVLGQGGFGITYEARDTFMDCTVAIKEFFVKDFCNRSKDTDCVIVATESKVELIKKLRAKFVEEAQALYRMNHHGIVRVTNLIEENNTAYYVMDYISGNSLGTFVKQCGKLSEEKALDYIRQVAEALRYVHSKNRLHLDIKPQNIMIDSKGKAVLIDFGVSKQYDEVNGENTSTLLGYTTGYAPIEQSGGGIMEFHAATDIYALAATFYELVTGITPTAANKRACSTKLQELTFPDDISPTVRAAIETSMRIHMENRPQSIGEFLALLDGSLAGVISNESEKYQTQDDNGATLAASVIEDRNSLSESEEDCSSEKKQRTDKVIAGTDKERRKIEAYILAGCAGLFLLSFLMPFYVFSVDDFYYRLETVFIFALWSETPFSFFVLLAAALFVLVNAFIQLKKGSRVMSMCSGIASLISLLYLFCMVADRFLVGYPEIGFYLMIASAAAMVLIPVYLNKKETPGVKNGLSKRQSYAIACFSGFFILSLMMPLAWDGGRYFGTCFNSGFFFLAGGISFMGFPISACYTAIVVINLVWSLMEGSRILSLILGIVGFLVICANVIDRGYYDIIVSHFIFYPAFYIMIISVLGIAVVPIYSYYKAYKDKLASQTTK